MKLLLAAVIIAAAVALMVRRAEVRLVLLGAGFALALLAGHPLAVADTFTRAMVAGMVAPICAAMGFAAVMNATGCDRHLVHLLLAPIRRVPWLVTPGGILAAYLVNMAVPSQTSTAAALGPILVPLLLASGRTRTVAGAALILGASFGGDLLNPGAQDIQAVAGAASLSAPALSARVIPASLAGALVAAVVFALLNRVRRDERAEPDSRGPALVTAPAEDAEFRIDFVKAAIPLVPIALLLLGYAGLSPLRWLVAVPAGEDWRPLANALPVVRAMLIGAALATLVAWRELRALATSFFEGMGSAYASIISLTITAQCFGAGIALAGVGDALLQLASTSRALAVLAGGFPWALSTLSGSGSGPILAFAQTFLPQVDSSHDPVKLAALACLGGAFGRTSSPVAAVVVYTSGLVGVPPVPLIRCFLPALIAGAAVAFALAAR
ncbi:MAG TPA: C4-dicarboxylate transporter DcuC [Vicinamibacteria bacterium]|nr:C4-dicarboxylate transporter DcuC [Vicinamibacteria bacterium]